MSTVNFEGLQTVLSQIPEIKHNVRDSDVSDPITLKPFDLNTLLLPIKSYYTYSGSLTTPFYDETVTWVLSADPFPVEMTGTQIAALRKAAKARNLPEANCRKLQPLYDRKVVFSTSE